MPKFEIITKEEAQSKSKFTGKSGQIMAMYMFFIEQLKEGKAGKLKAGDGETIQAIRRRLGKAAKLAGKEIVIKKLHDEIYFWLDVEEKPKRKRRTPAKNTEKVVTETVDNINRVTPISEPSNSFMNRYQA